MLSRARYTSPMPPAPRGARISYGPSLSPEDRGIERDQLSLADRNTVRSYVTARYEASGSFRQQKVVEGFPAIYPEFCSDASNCAVWGSVRDAGWSTSRK